VFNCNSGASFIKSCFYMNNRFASYFPLLCCTMQGLITKSRKGLDPAVARYARGFGPEEVQDLHEGASLVEVV
jgi:hypothetical protein